jgi:hypothetical protein
MRTAVFGRRDAERSSANSAPLKKDTVAAYRFLRLKGFEPWRNEETGASAVFAEKYMFQFEQISLRKAHEFFGWFQLYETPSAGLSTLPRGMKAFRVKEPRKTDADRPLTGPIPFSRPSIAMEGPHSNVPGHYAFLDCYGLRWYPI